jgi:uncharacterized protein YrzB (UPF0473 family)
MNNTIKMVIDGKEIVLDILYIFESLNANKKYVIYTDNNKDTLGNLNIYSSIYEDKKLVDIEDEKDWKEIETFLDKHIDGDRYE